MPTDADAFLALTEALTEIKLRPIHRDGRNLPIPAEPMAEVILAGLAARGYEIVRVSHG